MTGYYIVFFITVILCMVIPAQDKKQYLRKLIVVFLPLFLFGALRLDFGLDYSDYENEYYTLHHSMYGVDKDFHSEIGYQYLEVIMPTWRSLLILSAFATIGSLVFVFYKCVNKKYLLLAVILMFLSGNFIFFTPLVAMRNGIAIAIMLASLFFIRDRRFLLSLAIAFLGHYIHSSILLFMPVAYFVGTSKELTLKEISIWVGAIVVLGILGTSNLIDLLEKYLLLYMDRYEPVLNTMKENDHSSILASVSNIVLFAGIMHTFYQNRKSLTKTDNSIIRIGLIFLFSPFLGALGSSRMQCYFIPFFIAAVVRLYDCKWQSSVLKAGVYCLIFATFLYSFFYVWQWNNPYFNFQVYHSLIGDF